MKLNILYTLVILVSSSVTMAQGNLKTRDGQNYSIQYPAKWYLEEMEDVGLVMIDNDEDPHLITTFIVSPADGATLAETRKGLLEDSGLENSRVITDEIIHVGDQEMLHLVFIGANEVSPEPFRVEEFFAIKNEHSFMLAFACSETIYPEFEGSIGQILNSLKLK